MSPKRKPKTYDPTDLIEAVNSLPNPMIDVKHKLSIFIEGNARSNQTRVEHIVDYSHDLKVRDILSIPEGIRNYFAYKKDPTYKNTFNFYIVRKGQDKGFIKVSIRIDDNNPQRAWVKTIFIAYKIK
ncbi:MAG: hypothetical protein J5511_01245 [Bacilli bacterium]|nr:hypothetical protein [Bacilli bacterium]